ncbi:tetratricopeptide repeat protein [Brevundimonas subvibrioides]|uniref:Sel1 domain protein repeat-containing protein n=1 Tax=Brevundimonas subvibrioides (strain ATCC 15264 / DSM 4735 / LMG 14903 / NBRC 16000 / CB 81) TaxID=633149 RepID=D9QMQ9_BRESC|nr:SEL1-like repeat protein [Brevundimonas subvibrioides]ADL02065.1 Sel1 domain protein repeat-containing protein [Brevundimonas subvibrioides ATCC 15264]
MRVVRDGDASPDDRRRRRVGGPAAAIVVLALTAGTLAACGDNGAAFWRRSDSAAANQCPRPQSITGPEFNAQEAGLRLLRREAFRGDFFAQLELGSRYAAIRATDKNIEDPIESAVWTGLALANDEGYAPINRVNRGGWGGFRPASRYDDCRAWERHVAYQRLDRQLAQMTIDEQAAVRDRMIYVLSTQDAEGFRTLARLHDVLYGPYGEPSDNREAREAVGRGNGAGQGRGGYYSAAALFPRNDVDAYLYNYLATQTGDVGSYVLLKDFERSSPNRSRYGAFVEAKARQWVPPFEFYPNDAPASGVPFSDESRPRGDAYEYALGRMTELPFIHVGRALRYLGVTETVASAPNDLSARQIQSLEAMLGHDMESRLSYLEMVRAIQLAAVNGSSEAQLVLAVMYSEGIGVPTDYARAFHWYSQADRQGSPEAKFAISTYFALGVAGVADQDKAEAVASRIDSALAGFGPSASRLQAVLSQVSRSQRR